jgi:diguanylate cyclase (GGDEF)-like protein
MSSAQAEQLAQWLVLAGRRLNPAFPPAIEAVYEADCGRDRLRAMRLSTLAACVTGGLLIPLFWLLMPEMRRAMLALWVGGVLPIGLTCHALLYTKLPLRRLEWAVSAGGLAIGGLCSVLMAVSTHRYPSLYLGGMLLLTMLHAIAGALRFWPVAALVGGLFLEFAVTIPVLVDMDGVASAALIVLVANTSFYAMFGNWRLETEIRRNYALALRERLARQRLAQHNAELDDLAARDALTGLANRRTYDGWLGTFWSRAAPGGTPIGLVVIDIDYFKRFNDYYGHAAGDRCLQAVASCLREQSRDLADYVARLGGEEFAVLLPGLTLEVCGDVAERLRAAVAALELPHLGGDVGGIVTVSCGAASVAVNDGMSAEDLFTAADTALYAAKAAGRNCVRLGETRHARAAALG